jgi:hypothetical protein
VTPDWPGFAQTIALLRKKFGTSDQPPAMPLPKGLPRAFAPALQAVADSLRADWARIMDGSIPARKLFAQTPAYTGRYFWLEDGLAEVEDFEREVSKAWNKATSGHDDEASLLTLFVCVAAGAAHKTLLTEKAAASVIRKIRKSGLDSQLATQFIGDHAPAAYQADYLRMRTEFVEEALPVLRSDADYALHDALALLRRECNIAG